MWTEKIKTKYWQNVNIQSEAPRQQNKMCNLDRDRIAAVVRVNYSTDCVGLPWTHLSFIKWDTSFPFAFYARFQLQLCNRFSFLKCEFDSIRKLDSCHARHTVGGRYHIRCSVVGVSSNRLKFIASFLYCAFGGGNCRSTTRWADAKCTKHMQLCVQCNFYSYGSTTWQMVRVERKRIDAYTDRNAHTAHTVFVVILNVLPLHEHVHARTRAPYKIAFHVFVVHFGL